MSDPTHDPIRDLRAFGTGGLSVNPLAPDQVRRLGDQRRTRRRAATAIAASVLAVVGGIVPVTLAMTNDGTGSPPPANTPSITPTPTPTPSATTPGLGNIPADFPLDLDAKDYSDEGGEVRGPDPAVDTQPLDLCGTRLLSTKSAKGRLAFASTGPEVRDERSLVTYKDELAARTAWVAVAEQIQGLCTTWTADGVTRTLDLIAPGYDVAMVAFAITSERPGASVYMVSQVGSSILTLAHHSEIAPRSVDAVAADLDAIRKQLLPEMCIFAARCSTWTGTTSNEEERIYSYPGPHGAVIEQPADVERLRDVPQDFKDFIVAELETVNELARDGCDNGVATDNFTVSVARYSSGDVAFGKVGGCSGHLAFWALRNGAWTEILAGQDVWSCRDLESAGIGRSFVGGCFDQASDRFLFQGDFGPAGVDGVRLGMSATEVVGTGGTVTDLAGACGALLHLRSSNPEANRPSGYLTPDGKVAVIWAVESMVTPEGIGTQGRSRLANLHEAYPDGGLSGERNDAGLRLWTAPIDATTEYTFTLDDDDNVILMSLNRIGSLTQCATEAEN